MSKKPIPNYNIMNIPSIDSQLWEVKDLLKNNKYEQATALCQDIIDKNPQYLPAYQNMDAALRADHRNPLLIKLWRDYIEKNPEDPVGYHNLKTVLVEQDKKFEAIDVVTKYLQYYPNDYQAYLEKAAFLKNYGYYQEADSLYYQAISLNPNNYAAYHGIHNNRYQTSGLPKSLYEQYIAKNPDDYQAYHDRTESLGKHDNYQSKIQIYDDYIQKHQDYYPAYFDKAKALNERGEYDKALTTLDICIYLKPSDYNIYQEKAKILLSQGKKDLSLDVYDQYIAKYPHYYHAYADKAKFLTDQNQYELAIAVLDSYIQDHPDYFLAYQAKAEIYKSQKQLYLAIHALEQYQVIYPKDEQVYFAKAQIVDEQLADYYYNQAININPNNYQAYYKKSLLKESIGDRKKAIEIIDKYLTQAPNSYEAAIHKASIMENDEKVNEQYIYEAYYDCIKIEPYNQQAVFALTNFLVRRKNREKDQKKAEEIFTQAQKLLDEYIGAHPYNISGYLNKIDLFEGQYNLSSQERLVAIIKTIDDYIACNPNNINGYLKKIGILKEGRKKLDEDLEKKGILKRGREKLDEDLEKIIKLCDDYLTKFDGYHLFYKNKIELLQEVFQKNSSKECGRQLIETCQKAIEKIPNNFYFYQNLAQIYLSRRDNEQAILLWDQYFKNNPYNYAAYNAIAQAENSRGQGYFDLAIKYYDKYLEINPEYKKAYSDKADMLISQKKDSEAQEFVYKSIKIFPNHCRFYALLDKLLCKHGKVQEANKLADDYINQDPNDRTRYKDVAKYVSLRGFSQDEAMKILKRYEKLNPADFYAYTNITDYLLERAGDDIDADLVTEIMGYFQNYLNINQDNPQKYLEVVRYLDDISSGKCKMFDDPLTGEERVRYQIMSNLLDQHIKLYPKDWQGYEKKLIY